MIREHNSSFRQTKYIQEQQQPLHPNRLKYYQVSLTVRDENTLNRELRSLQRTGDHYPKYLLTMDMDLEADYNGITKINVIDWLLI